VKNEKIHSTLLALVGGYLLFLAYQLFEKYRTGTKEMPDAVFILAIVVFSVAGIGVIIWAWKIYRKQREEEQKNDENPGQIIQKKDNE
jgi:Na+-transporting NADH:ubiquinone oxidoreductase subunit NqrD